MKGRQKALFSEFFFCVDDLIVGSWGVVEWGRKSYLGPAEIESFVYCFRKNPEEQGEHLAAQPLWFCCWSRELGGEVSPRFPFVTQGGLRASPQTYRKWGSVI